MHIKLNVISCGALNHSVAHLLRPETLFSRFRPQTLLPESCICFQRADKHRQTPHPVHLHYSHAAVKQLLELVDITDFQSIVKTLTSTAVPTTLLPTQPDAQTTPTPPPAVCWHLLNCLKCELKLYLSMNDILQCDDLCEQTNLMMCTFRL